MHVPVSTHTLAYIYIYIYKLNYFSGNEETNKIFPLVHAHTYTYRNTRLHIYIYIYIYITKIIPTWPRANLPWFYQTALQDWPGEEVIFIILAISHVLSTLLFLALIILSVLLFSFDQTYVLINCYQVARVFSVFSFLTKSFPGYQSVEFENCTICFFFHTNRIID